MSSGDVWIGHIWGADMYPIQEENPNVVYYIPEEGGVRGSDTMAIFSGAKHPDRRAPVHQLHARRAGQRREHELHRLHGAERGRQGVHRPGVLDDPAVNPDQALVASSRSCSTSARRSATSTSSAGSSCVAVDPRAMTAGAAEVPRAATADGSRTATAHRPAALALLGPGVAWLRPVLRRPAGDHLRRQPRAARTRSTGSSSTGSTLRQLRAGARPRVPADVPELAALRVDHDDPVARHRLSRRLLDQPLRRAAQGPAARPRDAAVLDELPHPDLRLDDRPARQRGHQPDPAGARPDQRADHPAQHRPLGDPRHDVRVPAVRDPAAVRVHRPAGREPRRRPRATCTPAAAPPSST